MSDTYTIPSLEVSEWTEADPDTVPTPVEEVREHLDFESPPDGSWAFLDLKCAFMKQQESGNHLITLVLNGTRYWLIYLPDYESPPAEEGDDAIGMEDEPHAVWVVASRRLSVSGRTDSAPIKLLTVMNRHSGVSALTTVLRHQLVLQAGRKWEEYEGSIDTARDYVSGEKV